MTTIFNDSMLLDGFEYPTDFNRNEPINGADTLRAWLIGSPSHATSRRVSDIHAVTTVRGEVEERFRSGCPATIGGVLFDLLGDMRAVCRGETRYRNAARLASWAVVGSVTDDEAERAVREEVALRLPAHWTSGEPLNGRDADRLVEDFGSVEHLVSVIGSVLHGIRVALRAREEEHVAA